MSRPPVAALHRGHLWPALSVLTLLTYNTSVLSAGGGDVGDPSVLGSDPRPAALARTAYDDG
jgi:hypothetical protein